MSAATCLINGVRHSFVSIELILFGRIVTGFYDINYEKEKEYEDFYGAGPEPVHRGNGQAKYTGGSIGLYKYEVDAIEAAMPPGTDLTDIAPFNIKVAFLPTGSDALKVETICNVQFTKRSFKAKSGDKSLQMECPFIFAGLKVGGV